MNSNEPPTSSATDVERKRRRQRNLAVGGAVALFVVLIYTVTIIRLGGAVAERSF